MSRSGESNRAAAHTEGQAAASAEVPLRGADHPAEATPATAEEIVAQDAEESPAIASSL